MLFKIIFLDVGLMLAMSGLTYNDIKNMEHKQLVNLGDVCEQFTGQHLLFPAIHYNIANIWKLYGMSYF